MSHSRVSDRSLMLQVQVSQLMRDTMSRMRAALTKVSRDEAGQTPTEYLMIVGFMAAVIVAVFVIWYWDNVKTAAEEWSQSVGDTVSGSDLPKK